MILGFMGRAVPVEGAANRQRVQARAGGGALLRDAGRGAADRRRADGAGAVGRDRAPDAADRPRAAGPRGLQAREPLGAQAAKPTAARV
eukprot:6696873-Prymnesium_polylepis.1